MPSIIRTITVDCVEPHRLAQFWSQALGYGDDPEYANAPGDAEAFIVDPAGLRPPMLFIAVPESKTVKNRVHLDLRPDQFRDDEVERLLALGAAMVADQRTADGAGWAVLADPEGNEFCVERSAAERGEPEPVDTGLRTMPAVRVDDEQVMLTAMLDWYREGVRHKVEGLAPHLAGRSPLRSCTTIAGLVKHLALVEDSWFTIRLAGRPEPEPWASAPFDDDPDWDFHSAVDEPLADLMALYQAACARSRDVVASHGFDHVATHPDGRQFSLRFVVVHLLEETARHLGHLDVLRELLDGTTGE